MSMESGERLRRAVDYIEENLTGDIDLEVPARICCMSSAGFQRIFALVTDMTVAEYVRCRRLTLAGIELAAGKIKVIDAALKYGYDSPDSFGRAFMRFHGITPSAARQGQPLRSFSRIVLNISHSGGNIMDYRIEELPELVLTGYRSHFHGAPYGDERIEQEERLFITTRGKQYFLRGATEDRDEYCVVSNIVSDGYDFFYGVALSDWVREHLYDHSVTGVEFVEGMGLETVTIPHRTYVVFETKDQKQVINNYSELLGQRGYILTEWLPDMGFRLADVPELYIYHWEPRRERNISIWLPIERLR